MSRGFLRRFLRSLARREPTPVLSTTEAEAQLAPVSRGVEVLGGEPGEHRSAELDEPDLSV